MNNQMNNTTGHVCCMSCISWSAILLGALVAVGLGFLSTLLCLTVRLSAFSLGADGLEHFSTWGFIGLAAITIVVMYFSGWIAGYFGRSACAKKKSGEVYGFIAWVLWLIMSILLAAQVGPFLAQRAFVVGNNIDPVKITREVVIMPEAAAAKATSSAKANAAAAAVVAAVISNDVENTNTMLIATFFLLFIGALTAAFGGRCGIRSQSCCQ